MSPAATDEGSVWCPVTRRPQRHHLGVVRIPGKPQSRIAGSLVIQHGGAPLFELLRVHVSEQTSHFQIMVRTFTKMTDKGRPCRIPWATGLSSEGGGAGVDRAP